MNGEKMEEAGLNLKVDVARRCRRCSQDHPLCRPLSIPHPPRSQLLQARPMQPSPSLPLKLVLHRTTLIWPKDPLSPLVPAVRTLRSQTRNCQWLSWRQMRKLHPTSVAMIPTVLWSPFAMRKPQYQCRRAAPRSTVIPLELRASDGSPEVAE
ncbi:hypothetical protein GN956_G1833 [Arapaima gigas]